MIPTQLPITGIHTNTTQIPLQIMLGAIWYQSLPVAVQKEEPVRRVEEGIGSH